jgi:chemotaxis signal transduction protein
MENLDGVAVIGLLIDRVVHVDVLSWNEIDSPGRLGAGESIWL